MGFYVFIVMCTMQKVDTHLIYKVVCCVCAFVCDHWTQKKVTGKRKVTVDAEKSDEKKIRRP